MCVGLGLIMDLGGWLRSLGLERYEAAFRANAIDADVLCDLTDQDLEKLGVLLGHRRKLLRATRRARRHTRASNCAAPHAITYRARPEINRRHIRNPLQKPQHLVRASTSP